MNYQKWYLPTVWLLWIVILSGGLRLHMHYWTKIMGRLLRLFFPYTSAWRDDSVFASQSEERPIHNLCPWWKRRVLHPRKLKRRGSSDVLQQGSPPTPPRLAGPYTLFQGTLQARGRRPSSENLLRFSGAGREAVPENISHERGYDEEFVGRNNAGAR